MQVRRLAEIHCSENVTLKARAVIHAVLCNGSAYEQISVHKMLQNLSLFFTHLVFHLYCCSWALVGIFFLIVKIFFFDALTTSKGLMDCRSVGPESLARLSFIFATSGYPVQYIVVCQTSVW